MREVFGVGIRWIGAMIREYPNPASLPSRLNSLDLSDVASGRFERWRAVGGERLRHGSASVAEVDGIANGCTGISTSRHARLSLPPLVAAGRPIARGMRALCGRFLGAGIRWKDRKGAEATKITNCHPGESRGPSWGDAKCAARLCFRRAISGWVPGQARDDSRWSGKERIKADVPLSTPYRSSAFPDLIPNSCHSIGGASNSL